MATTSLPSSVHLEHDTAFRRAPPGVADPLDLQQTGEVPMDRDLGPELKLLVRDDLLYRDLDDEGIIYDATKSKVHALNATAALIWRACDGEHTVEDIVEELLRRFDVDRDTARRDIRKTIKQFGTLGLLAERQSDVDV